jgi:uncharacterized membrane protein (DUF373 family)
MEKQTLGLERSDEEATRYATRILKWTERVIFFVTGVLLFVASIAFLKESFGLLLLMFGSQGTLEYGTQFLDRILLVLMLVELAYTVILSLRGSVLMAEPFLIVGLIAVIRRMLVITVGETGANVVTHVYELAILTVIVIVFVASIALLRMRRGRAGGAKAADPQA